MYQHNLPFYAVARNLNIAPSTAHETFCLFENTGRVDPVRRKERPEIRALDLQTKLQVIGFILDNPSAHIIEVCYFVHDATGEMVSPSTINFVGCLKDMDLQGEKIRHVAVQRCELLRESFHGIHISI